MAIAYYKVKRNMWVKGEKVTKYYAAKHIQNTLTEDDIAERLTKSLSMEAPEITLLMDELADQITTAVLNGQSVKVDGLGTFSPSLKTRGSENVKEADASKIEKVKINFRPDAKLKRVMQGAELRYFKEIEAKHV